MESRARVTSKGQVTIPVDVRRSLGIVAGDELVFELASTYATVRKRRPTLEVAAEMQARFLAGRTPRYTTNREAIEAHFAEKPADDLSDRVLVSRGDGTFEGDVDLGPDSLDADR